MRKLLSLLPVSLAVLLFPPPASGCSCISLDQAWPSGLEEVPLSAHVLIWTRATSDRVFELREVPTPKGGWTDDIERALVSAQHPLPPQGKTPFPLPEPSGTRVVSVKRNDHGAPNPTSVVELVPEARLKPSTRYVVIDRMKAILSFV
jgi:hypothetical protein